MAVIGKIRKHSTLLLIVVGGAIVLFVLGDLFGGRRGGGRKNKIPDIAVVGREKISYRDFNTKLEEQMDLYKQQYGENINNQLLFQIREQVFNEMVKQVIYNKEYSHIDIRVTQPEMADMMTGVNIHPIIKQNFTDPQTGQFNPALVERYLMRLDSLDQKQKNQWFSIEKLIKEQRILTKYQNLLSKAFFVPKAMAKTMYTQQGTYASAKVFSVKYASVPDDSIKLTDKDYKDYYENHKNEYEQEDSRWLDFVVFDVLPSEKDKQKASAEINVINEEFINLPYQNMKENFLFASMKSDLDFKTDTGFVKRTSLPAQADELFDKTPGSVVGPYMENNTYFIHKLLAKESRADSLKASHILISYKGAMRADPNITRTKEIAKSKADSLLTVVKKTDSTQFAKIATDLSDDKSAQTNGGDLGWFTDGTMVPAFTEGCMKANIGEYFVVESPFGFHVIHLLGKKGIQLKVKMANISFSVEPSNETRQQIFTEASKFAGDNKSIETFDKAITDKGYTKRSSEQTRTSDYTIPGVQEGREIVRWAFGDTIEEGNVSEVFDLLGENKNVVVLVRKVRTKGIAPLEQIKEEIEPLVKKEKKADKLLEKVSKAYTNGMTIENYAQSLKDSVIVVERVIFASNNVPLIGPEPKVVGAIFSTPKDVISKPIKGEAGIFVIQVISTEDAQATEDYSTIVNNLQNNFKNRVNYEAYNAMLKNANMKEHKILFY